KVSESTEEPKSESTDGKEITPLLDSTNMPVNNEQKENVESQKSEDQKPPTDFNEELNVNDENIKTMTIDQLKKELIEANKELNISDEQKSIDEIEALHSNSFTDDNSFKDDLEKKLMEVKELQKNKKQRKKQQGD
ncbi:MAG: hypothetical protein ACP5UL_01490, partial [Thermoplasmata archaeon]